MKEERKCDKCGKKMKFAHKSDLGVHCGKCSIELEEIDQTIKENSQIINYNEKTKSK
mgnify:CR=1 FL=1|tara:strand:+ start:38465 stop:38635 length:171 start_codon:yes stop_codon:yes gene_type:complete